jgi:hypothetical protein
MKTGTRVLAVKGTKGGVVSVYGAGEFIGDVVPGERPEVPLPVGFIASIRPAGIPNPLIRLDTGQYVWGCECWWGELGEANQRISGLDVEGADIDADRAKYHAESTPANSTG